MTIGMSVRISPETASAEEMKIRGSRHAELYGTRYRFQFPVAVGAWISFHGNTP